MRKFFKAALPIILAAMFLISLSACHKRVETNPTPSNSPKASVSPTESASTRPSASPKTTDNAAGSASPSGSPMTSTMPTGAPIEGFVEGMVIDPDDVPHLVQLLAEHDEYKGLAIQSVTYKLRGGRQAYYVILQGEGDASRRVYVFADDTIEGE